MNAARILGLGQVSAAGQGIAALEDALCAPPPVADWIELAGDDASRVAMAV